MDLYQNNYRVKSTRLRGYDYASPGYYFITICTKNRICWFGSIANNTMILSNIGIIATEFWREIADHFSGIRLDKFVVMPNHVHGIIQILPPAVETPKLGVSTDRNVLHFDELTAQKPRRSISIMINQYKRACTNRIKRELNQQFSWQSRFYDHIIRDNDTLHAIRKYIRDNIKNWRKDENYA